MSKTTYLFKALFIVSLIVLMLPLAGVSAKEKQFDPFEMSISEISEALNRKEITSEELVEIYLERILSLIHI